MTAALEGGEWPAAGSGRTLLPEKTWYPFYRRLGGPQGRSWRAENFVPTGIRSRTVQPVAQSLYQPSYRHTLHNLHCRKMFVTVIVFDEQPTECAKRRIVWISWRDTALFFSKHSVENLRIYPVWWTMNFIPLIAIIMVADGHTV